jgi:NADH-quinone oxidoreductase E subunit
VSFHPKMPYETGIHRSERELSPKGEPFVFNAENTDLLDRIIARYPPDRRRSALIPALHLVQKQQGYITASAMRTVAEVIGCTPAEVEDVVSFYTMFYTRPVGKYVIQVCRTLSCALMGAERVTEEISKELGIGIGETDASGTFTLMEVECLGACDRAPVVMVNDEHWHECLKPEEVARFLEDLRTRGEAALSGCHLEVEKLGQEKKGQTSSRGASSSKPD